MQDVQSIRRLISILAAGFLLAPVAAQAQNFTRVEAIEYHDDPALWVMGQVKKTTCISAVPADPACNGGPNAVMSQVDYGWKALRWKTYEFGLPVQTLSYDATSSVASGQLGTLKSVMDGNGNTTTLTSWKRGVPQLIVYPATAESPAGATQSASVSDLGWITWVTDETGSRTCYGHDGMGRINRITYPSEAAANTCNTSTWAETTISFTPGHAATYGMPAGHWRQTTLTGNGRRVVVFDALWRPVVSQVVDAGNVNETLSATFTRYDASGRPAFSSYPVAAHGTTSFTDASIKGTSTIYDALGRVTQVRQDWEGSGQLLTGTEYLSGFRTRVTDARLQQTTTAYQAWDAPGYDHPTSITHPAGAYTEISRDAFGKPTTVTRRNADSSAWQRRYFFYDPSQRLCKSKETETGTTAYGYDGVGNLIWSAAGLPWSNDGTCEYSSATAASRRVDRVYDARNRLTSLVFPEVGLGDQSWTYAPDGLPVAITTRNASGTSQHAVNRYTYNRRRLLTRESLEFAGVVNWPVDYGYNANGHLASHAWHGISVSYAPNALGQATQAGVYASEVKYHPNGGIKQFTYGNGIQHSLTQNIRGLPDTSCDFFGVCNASAIVYDGYDYDQVGNVAAISDGRTGQKGNRTMSYDGMNRLTHVTSGSSSSPNFGAATYAYNALDNITSVEVTGGTHDRNHHYCYDGTMRLTNIKTGSCSGATVVGMGYDVQGNLSNKSGRTYVFDYGNRLRSTTNPATSYAYDGHGRRVLDQVGAGKKYSHYLLDGSLSMTGDERAGKVSEYIYLQGSLVAIRQRDVPTGVYTTRYQHTDALGSPVAVTDQNRTPLERTYFEPYGLPDRAWRDGPGYTGHVEDAAIQLSYMQQRYYDPAIGRFLSVDPVEVDPDTGDDFNRYAYAYNNPYSFTDPDGRMPLDEKEPPPPPPPQPTNFGAITVTATAPTTPNAPAPTNIGTITVTAPRPMPQVPSIPRIPWVVVGEFTATRLVPPALLFYPTPMGYAACEMPDGPPCGPIVQQAAEHTKGARPSTKGKHEKGRARAKADRHGGEKGDDNRDPYGKRPPGHKGPWPPKD